MRLIDADELFNAFEKNGWYDSLDRDDVAEELLLKAPTVDAVPVVHGNWVERFTGNEWIVHCSNCKVEATEMADYHTIYSYCPYCGAKMDEYRHKRRIPKYRR